MTLKYIGAYKCECGREFTNSQAFNGHKSHCKVHLGEDRYQKNTSSFNSNFELGTSASVISRKKSADKKYLESKELWESTIHYCEKCGKELPKLYEDKFGSGRFCSRSCANSHEQTDEIKQKLSKQLSKEHVDYYCLCCGKKLFKKTKSGYCKECYHKYIPYPESAKEKQRLVMAGKPRWNIHRNKRSYAELFFEKVFSENKIKFEKEYCVKKPDGLHCYWLDFLIKGVNGYLYDIEIDGKQHLYRVEEDKVRDEYISSLGYIVYRIPWNDIKSNSGKLLMKEKIDALLSVICAK